MRFLTKKLTLSVLVASTLAFGSAIADQIKTSVDVQPGRTLSEQDQYGMELAAARVLRHATDARVALAKDDLDSAKSELSQAQTLMKLIERIRPTSVIQYDISSGSDQEGDVQYHDKDVVALEMIPVSLTQSNIVDLIPGPAKKTESKKVESSDSSSENPDYEDIVVTSRTEVAMPFTPVKELIDAAAKGLSGNEKDSQKKADLALRLVQQSVVVDVVEEISPLESAKLALWNATEQAAAKNIEAAKASLEKAEKWLGETAKEADEKIQSESAKLSEKLTALKNKLTQ